MPWWTAPSERSWNDEKAIGHQKALDLNLPYIQLGLFATNFGEAWRMAQGADASAKMLAFFSTLPVALASWWPSLHPLDLLVGVFAAAVGFGWRCTERQKRQEVPP